MFPWPGAIAENLVFLCVLRSGISQKLDPGHKKHNHTHSKNIVPYYAFYDVLQRPPRPRLLCFGQTRFCLYLLCFCAELHWQPSESMGIIVNGHSEKHSNKHNET